VRDITRPSAVATIAKECDPYSSNTWNLSWTATADDSTYSGTGAAYQVDVRMHTSSITEANWSSATSVGGPTPATPGNTNTWQVTAEGLRYVRMKVRDDVGNWSLLSSQITVFPFVDCGEGLYGGGGGGGESATWRPEGTSSMGGTTEETTDGPAAVEHSILDGVETDVLAADIVDVSESMEPDNTVYHGYVRAVAGTGADLDAIRLIVVDHTEDVTCVATATGFVVGTVVEAVDVLRGEENLRDQLGQGSDGVLVSPGDVLLVATDADATGSAFVIRCASDVPSDCVIVVKDEEENILATRRPRKEMSSIGIARVPSGRIRLEFGGYATVQNVARLIEDTASSSSQEVLPVADDPLYTEALRAVDDSTVAVGDAPLEVNFEVAPCTDGRKRSAFLRVDGAPTGGSNARMSEDARALRQGDPLSFAMYQNAPNPFSVSTELRFDLPTARHVTIHVFDSQGRRVAVPVDRSFEAGRHVAHWTPERASLRPGIYWCRMRAGSFEMRRKLVFIR
jgi:hypothetical protein